MVVRFKVFANETFVNNGLVHLKLIDNSLGASDNPEHSYVLFEGETETLSNIKVKSKIYEKEIAETVDKGSYLYVTKWDYHFI